MPDLLVDARCSNRFNYDFSERRKKAPYSYFNNNHACISKAA